MITIESIRGRQEWERHGESEPRSNSNSARSQSWPGDSTGQHPYVVGRQTTRVTSLDTHVRITALIKSPWPVGVAGQTDAHALADGTSILRCRREPKCTGGAQIQAILSEISPHRFVGLRSLVRLHRVGVLWRRSRIPREKPYFGFRCRRPFSRSSGVSAGMRTTREASIHR
jgi:hypothetical protein